MLRRGKRIQNGTSTIHPNYDLPIPVTVRTRLTMHGMRVAPPTRITSSSCCPPEQFKNDYNSLGATNIFKPTGKERKGRVGVLPLQLSQLPVRLSLRLVAQLRVGLARSFCIFEFPDAFSVYCWFINIYLEAILIWYFKTGSIHRPPSSTRGE